MLVGHRSGLLSGCAGAGRGRTRAPRPLGPRPGGGRSLLAARGRPLPLPPPRVAAATDSTDLDEEAQDPHDEGLYVRNRKTALHVGFSGPGWRMVRDASGYVHTLVDYCSPGRIRLSFGAAAGKGANGDVEYAWGRAGWGAGAAERCLSSSLGDEKPRFYLTARQAAAIVAQPDADHRFEAEFKGWRGDEDGCPVVGEEGLEGGITCVKTLTWESHSSFLSGCTVKLSIKCSDGFAASTSVTMDAADYLVFESCVRFAIPHLLGLHGVFRLPTREDYFQDEA